MGMGSGCPSMPGADEMVVTPYAMSAIRKGRPAKGAESVMMRGDNSSAMQRVLTCRGGEGEE